MPKNIYCTQCNRTVMRYDEKGTSVLQAKCNKCNMLITYNPITDKLKISKLPSRNTSSGVRFY